MKVAMMNKKYGNFSSTCLSLSRSIDLIQSMNFIYFHRGMHLNKSLYKKM